MYGLRSFPGETARRFGRVRYGRRWWSWLPRNVLLRLNDFPWTTLQSNPRREDNKRGACQSSARAVPQISPLLLRQSHAVQDARFHTIQRLGVAIFSQRFLENGIEFVVVIHRFCP